MKGANLFSNTYRFFSITLLAMASFDKDVIMLLCRNLATMRKMVLDTK